MKAIKHKQYYVKEPPWPYPNLRSGVLLGSSGQGKSHTMLSLLMGPYKNLHSRVIIVSPSVHVDPLWQVWKDFVEANYDWSDELDDTLFDSYDEDKLRKIVDQHKRVNMELKRRHKGGGRCKLYSLCIFFDDMASDAELHNSRSLIAEIFLRHRHNFVQAIVSTQKWRSISTAVRAQVCWIIMWGMRSADERKAAIQEFSGMYSQKVIEMMHEEATRERFNFLYVNLLAPTREEAFFKNFDYKIKPV